MEGGQIPHFKVVILGNTGCGKTAIIQRWISNTFTENSKPTIGSNHQRKRVVLDGFGPVDLYVWDTAGQEQFQSLMPLYVRSSSLAICTASIDDVLSFQALPQWIATIRSSCDQPPPMVLAVNKMDLAENAVLTQDEIQERYGSNFRATFFVSALTGECIDQLFTSAALEAGRFSAKVPEVKTTEVIAGSGGGEQGCC
jgi:small GTP-binding protein